MLRLSALSLLLAPGCLIGNIDGTMGNGDVITEGRSVEPWSRLQVEGGIEVVVNPTPAGTVTVRSDSNLVDLIETQVEDETLVVRVRDGAWIGLATELVVTADTDALVAVNASGGSPVHASFAAGDAALVASGGSTLEADGLSAGTVLAALSGGSVAHLAGTANTLNVDASGGSVLEALDLSTVDATVIASGSSVVEITATGQVDGDVSGGSSLLVQGGGDAEGVVMTGGSTVTTRE